MKQMNMEQTKYKIIVADDEYYIRRKLTKIIDYEGLGLELAGDFENGREVIDYFSKDQADIVLLDIRMPKVSGLDTAEFLHRSFPNTKVIILSGFNDFEYAQKTLRYHVFDYLLKPVDADTLNSAIRGCISAINKRRLEIRQLDSLAHYEKSMLLNQVLRKKEPLHALAAAYPQLMSANYSMFYSFFIDVECSRAAKDLYTVLTGQKIECEYFIESDHIFYIQFFLEDDIAEPLCQYHCKKFFHGMANRFYYYFGVLFDVQTDWDTRRRQAPGGLDNRYFSAAGNLSSCTVSPGSSSLPEHQMSGIDAIRHPLLQRLNASDSEGFCAFITELFQTIAQRKSVEYFHLAVMEVFAAFSVKYSSQKNYRPLPRDYAQSVIAEEYRLEEVQSVIIHYGLDYMKNTEAVPSDIRLSKNIIQYLMEHYQEPDLTVTSLAACFQLNVSYMGSVFKKVNHTSILQFLTTLRMTEAKNLLKTGQYKVTEVAEAVGYTDVFYFSKRFKAFCGHSPKEYMLENAAEYY